MRDLGKDLRNLQLALLEQNDKPIYYISKIYGDKYIVPKKEYEKLNKENELLKEIIKSFFVKGSPLHQYTDTKFGLTIEVDNECSIMHLGEYKGVDLDKKLKEVLNNE